MRHHGTLIEILPKKPLVGVELGVYKGELCGALLAAFPKLHLHLVDAWRAFPADSLYVKSGDGASRLSDSQHLANKLETIARVESYPGRYTIWHCLGNEAARAMLDNGLKETIDFIFIDAEHTEPAVKSDIMMWWPLIKRGGIISGHDYGHRRFGGVKLAVDAFIERGKLKLSVGPGMVWWFQKPV